MRGRRDVAGALVGGLLERREIDERLERRADLPPRRGGAVELRLVVGAAADEREDLAGARIDGDERGLRDARRSALAARQDRIDVGDAGAHRFLRVALQVQVERGVDVERAGLRHDAGKRACRAHRRRSRRSTAPRCRRRARPRRSVPCCARSAASAVM